MATINSIGSSNPIEVGKGGIGVNTLTDHSLLVGSGTNPVTALTVGGVNEVLLGSVGANPTWGAVSNACLTNSSVTLNNGNNITVTGSPLSLGGVASFNITGTTNYAVQLGNAGGSLSSLALGDATKVLTSSGAGSNPTWETPTVGTVTSVSSGTNTNASGTATDPILNLDDAITLSTVNATTFDTNVASAGVTLAGVSLIADGTDANISLNVTPKGTGVLATTELTLTTDLAVEYGGTGASTHTSHGVLLGAGAGAVKSTCAGNPSQILTSNGASADPTWGSVSLTASVTGKLPIGNGGTNADIMATTYGVNYYDGTKIVTTGVGNATQVLTSNGAGVAPTFQDGGGGGGSEFADNVFRIKDNTDATKKIAFEASGITTSTVRTITMCDSNLDLSSPSFSGSVTAGTGITITANDLNITSGKINLPTTTSTDGQITINGTACLHSYGGSNFFLGGAGNFTLSGAVSNLGIGTTALDSLNNGDYNVAIGENAGTAVTGGNQNVFVGYNSGASSTTGSDNVAIGWEAYRDLANSNGQQNVAVGASAMRECTGGLVNVAIGSSALRGLTNTSARENVGIGAWTFRNLTAGSYNIAIGSVTTSGVPYGTGGALTGSDSDNILFSNYGVAGDNHTIRIGTTGTANGQQNKAFIAGTYNVTPVGGNDATVIMDTNGQLGTTTEPVGKCSINSQTGTAYTLVIGDKNRVVKCSNASAITLTVPTYASVAFGTGTMIGIIMEGVGQLSIAPASGVTINSEGSKLKIDGQYATAMLLKKSADVWNLSGQIKA